VRPLESKKGRCSVRKSFGALILAVVAVAALGAAVSSPISGSESRTNPPIIVTASPYNGGPPPIVTASPYNGTPPPVVTPSPYGGNGSNRFVRIPYYSVPTLIVTPLARGRKSLTPGIIHQ